MRFISSSALWVLVSLSLVYQTTAGPVVQRDGTTSATTPTTAATAALLETSVSGKATTLEVAVPSETTGTSTGTKKTTAAVATATSTSTSSTSSSGSATGVNAPASSFLSCNRPSGTVICSPNNNTNVTVGDTYYVTWDPARFEVNTTITIVLNYGNDSTHRAAWTSEGQPKEKGFVTVQMDKKWLQDSSNNTLEFGLISYVTAGSHTRDALEGPTIFLTSKGPSHFKPPPHTKMPDKLSLLIGLPLGLGALLFVLIGLFFGMRKQRQIGVGSVMGRGKKGYGVGKSRRQRVGKEGAIRLEEREVLQTRVPPLGSGHAREESLGSLVSDNEGKQGNNAFRDEMKKQRTGR
ncbi:hypothetical protein EJ08DRAFT_732751 [Tothia fuscella]|uniref:Uncharacterized protein n=1 Tax=Tothia fuscella TaxID=1048955 RepID=A0A9P4NTN7_9PEZI|nr:hypothetical protein EJ08DRAFT_732751 [Tothia fuscella]